MSTNLGPLLPPRVLAFLSGEALDEKLGIAFLLVTPGDDGFPHPCIVSPGEIVALNASTLHLALHGTSTATRNLRAHAAASLALVLDGAAYYVKVEATELQTSNSFQMGARPPNPRHMGARPPNPQSLFDQDLAAFRLTPRHVLQDKESGAEVTSGFTFSDERGSAAILAQWQSMVNALRRLPA